MAKMMAVVWTMAGLLVAASAAQAACGYEGQRYPAGTVLCIGGKIYTCEANDAWKVDRSSACTN